MEEEGLEVIQISPLGKLVSPRKKLKGGIITPAQLFTMHFIMVVMVVLAVLLALKVILEHFMFRQRQLLMLREKNCPPQHIRRRSIR